MGFINAVGVGREELCTRLSCLLLSHLQQTDDLLYNFNRKQFKMQLYQLLYVRTENVLKYMYSAFCKISAFLQ